MPNWTFTKGGLVDLPRDTLLSMVALVAHNRRQARRVAGKYVQNADVLYRSVLDPRHCSAERR